MQGKRRKSRKGRALCVRALLVATLALLTTTAAEESSILTGAAVYMEGSTTCGTSASDLIANTYKESVSTGNTAGYNGDYSKYFAIFLLNEATVTTAFVVNECANLSR